MTHTQVSTVEGQGRIVDRCFSFQHHIYNTTRWPFLFGRKEAIRALPFTIEKQLKILEVDCGTGHNLRQLARWFPNASITGMDVSSHLIEKAGQATAAFQDRVELIQEAYTSNSKPSQGAFDAILFSYSLSRSNQHWRDVIRQAWEGLRPGGVIAVVDFHDSRFSWFKGYMANRQVRMDGHLLPFLHSKFKPLKREARPAYGGIWEYFLYLGRKEE